MNVNYKLLSITAIALVPLTVVVFYALYGRSAAAGFLIVDMESDFLSGIIAAVIGLVALQVVPFSDPRHRGILTTLWLARISVTLGFMLFYESYYVTLDAFSYYRDGIALDDPLGHFAFGRGTEIVEAFVGVLSWFTHSYSAFKVVFSFLGLMSVYIVYIACTWATGREMPWLLLALGLMPSIVFWTSILGKDPVVSFGISIACVGAVGYLTGRGWQMLVLFAVGVAIAASIRSWLSLIFLAPFLATIFLGGRLSLTIKAAVIALALPVFLVALQGFTEQFAIESARDLVARTNKLAQGFSQGGSAQAVGSGYQSLAGMVVFLPQGMFAALFRPLPGEVMNPFGIMAGLENAAVLVLLIKGAVRQDIRAVLRQPLLLWAVLTLLAWAALYGFVSYYNLGAAFRFRQMVTPILFPMALYLAYGPRLPRRGTR